MNTHHDELIVQFGLLTGVQNKLKESFTVVASSWQTNKELPYLTAINQWEQEVINRVQQIAAKARTTANEMMAKNISDIHDRLDQLTVHMQKRQQEGNFFDNDIIGVRNQLEQLNYAIKNVNEKIRINYKATNKINWGSLLNVTTEKNFPDNRFSLLDLHYDQDKIWNNLRKLMRNKHTDNDYTNKQLSLKRTKSSLFEPIALISFGSSTCSLSQQNAPPQSEATMSDNSFSNDDPFNYITFTSIDCDQLFPQASDA